MTRWTIRVGALALALFALDGPAKAQTAGSGTGPNLEGLTVMGKGVVGARPNRLEIDLEVSAASEISSDVIVKYRDAKKRLQEAFSALKMPNVTVEEKALGVDQKGQAYNPYYMDTPPARKGKVEVQLKRKLVVACSGIRDLDEEALLQLVAKLLDVAQDAGGKLGGGDNMMPYYYYRGGGGSNGLVRFILDDFDALQDKAYEAAIADARKRAERIARLSGVTLGPVAGVREALVPGEKTQGSGVTIYEFNMNQGDEEMPRKRLEAAKFQEIPVRVEIQVRFDLAGAAKADRQGGGK